MEFRLRLLLASIVVGILMLTGCSGEDSGTLATSQPAADATTSPTKIISTPAPTMELPEIVVAIQNIPRGTVIQPEAVRLQPWPADHVPPNAIFRIENVLGSRPRTDIYVEQPILTPMIIPRLDDNR